MDDKLRIEVDLFNNIMDCLYELSKVVPPGEERNGVVKSRVCIYEFFRRRYNDKEGDE